jgi:LysR family transcriptional regulator, carnitine catabolism transcriptional activator
MNGVGMAPASSLPDLSTRHLRAIVALARSGKFVAAATELGISQPSLSRMIQQAESELGAVLFVRATRRVAQTAAGREFVPLAERMLDELMQRSQAIRELDGRLRGQIVVASLMSIAHHVVPAALVAFRKQHPGVFIQVREGIASGVLEDVRSGLADFGIGAVPEGRREIVVQSVVEEPCCLVLPRRHKLNGQRSVRLADLADEPMISMPADSGLRRVVDTLAQAQGVDLNHSIITSQFTSLFDFVAQGLGIAIVPLSALPPAFERRLATRTLRPGVTRRIGVLHLADRPLSVAAVGFLEIFRPMLMAAIR